MLSLRRALGCLCLATAGLTAILPRAGPERVDVTTTIEHVQPRQTLVTPMPTPGSGVTATMSASTSIVNETLSATTEEVASLTSATLGPPTSWKTLVVITTMGSTISWSTCGDPAQCNITGAFTWANGSGGAAVVKLIPVIVKGGGNGPPNVPTLSTLITTSGSSSSLVTSSNSSSFSSSSMTSSNSSSVSSSKVNSTSSEGPSCSSGAPLLLDPEEEGDNLIDSCPRAMLKLNDEEDGGMGDDWNDYGPSAKISIPYLTIQPSTSLMKGPAVPSLSRLTTSKALVAPQLLTSANRPNPGPTTTSSPAEIAVPRPLHSPYKCENIRPYTGKNAKNDCINDRYCQYWEWWGPSGENPYGRVTSIKLGTNNTWEGFERTCEPVQNDPKSYYCKSCTRNPDACKTIRHWTNDNKDKQGRTALEACWIDEICERDRDHTRICHLERAWANVLPHETRVFCMEYPRNAHVEPELDGCCRQMDFVNDGRKELNTYMKGATCDNYCKSDDLARWFCAVTPNLDQWWVQEFTGKHSQCFSCRHR
ncbi:hypothetical protein BU23DRAFT_595991 [Bimuria novae-zelandiae CBS 107.79]|uniref:Ig-like domain-containing protein n=1 Tax=Bimuria novae-zelandiae CBS 107.79 TaxID=1447943 RepID=A0A6A5VLV1_9PLEO|nr:hypothetical protein BU23DRAFT_595991 [Bimuria novae-zelandiae CBS 107.79]